jgi:hypothetical protein
MKKRRRRKKTKGDAVLLVARSRESASYNAFFATTI